MRYKNLDGRLHLKVFIKFLAFETSNEITTSIKIEALLLSMKLQEALSKLETELDNQVKLSHADLSECK